MEIEISSRQEVQAYFDSDRVNQSTLKDLLYGLDDYKKKLSQREAREESGEIPDYFLVGSAVDTILTGQVGDFEEEFYILDLERKPSDTEIAILEYTFKLTSINGITRSLEDHLAELEEAIQELQWYKGKPGAKRIENLINGGKEYFEALKQSHGKKILSLSQKLTVDSVVNSLKGNSRTAQFFDRDSFEMSNLIKAHYQKIIYFEYKNLELKAMLDMLVFTYSEEGKPLTARVIELKTMEGSTLDFLSNLKRFRYDFQVAFYNLALENYLKQEGYDKVEILPPVFVVESTSNPGTPLVYHVDKSLLQIGRFGRREFKVPGDTPSDYVYYRPIKGFEEMLDDYKFYRDRAWATDKIIYQNPGGLRLTWDKII